MSASLPTWNLLHVSKVNLIVDKIKKMNFDLFRVLIAIFKALKPASSVK